MSCGFYKDTYAITLPHPPIRLPVLLVIENALCAAWDILRREPRMGFDLRGAREDDITHELHEILFNRVFNSGLVAGFDKRLFVVGVREPKLRNFNYTILDKMPDLLVGLVGRPPGIINTQDGLFIECKPVDRRHGVRGHYCAKGILRFAQGDYAWTMTTAMMIGYAAEGYTVRPKLVDALKKPPTGIARTVPQPCRRSKAGPHSEAVYLTEHHREFKYRETRQAAPPIVIRHLWLKRD